MPKVLIVATSWDKLGDTGNPTGSWAEEVMAPYYVFKSAGIEVTISSVKGGEIPFDESSLNPPHMTKEVEKFLLDDEAMKLVEESVPLADVAAAADYDAIFLAGGHGTCWDFPDNDVLATLLSRLHQAGKVISAVCHGPNGLVKAVNAEGVSILKGRKATAFSDDEEHAVALEKVVPFSLEKKLIELGAKYEKAPTKWEAHAVWDGNLVTGQNPGSSVKTAEYVVKALGLEVPLHHAGGAHPGDAHDGVVAHS